MTGSIGASRLVFVAALAAAGLSLGGPNAEAFPSAESDLPPASSWDEAGLDRSLVGVKGPARVRVVLDEQRLLRRSSRGKIGRLLRPRLGPYVRQAARASTTKITRMERLSARRLERRREEAIRAINLRSSIQAQRDLSAAQTKVVARGGRVVERVYLPAELVVRIDGGKLPAIAATEGVRAVMPAKKEHELLDVSHVGVGASAWWSAGHTGGTGLDDAVPADAAIRSEAVDPSHPAFVDVQIDNEPEATISDHGTHTGGIIASGDSLFTGVAPGIDRLIGADTTEYALGVDTGEGPGADDAAEVISSSFGGPAINDNDGMGLDVLVGLHHFGRADAAGNEHVLGGGGPTVGNIGRNIISVAAYDDDNTVVSTDDTVLGVSSRGPSPGGRKKPDLTAPGGSIVAPSVLWNSPPGNPDFTAMSGTSFSTPHVAGGMALLAGAGITDPMVQRAILINSARDWDGTVTGLNGWSAPQIGWRPEVGWGALDLTRAFAERGNYQLGEVREGEAAFFRAPALEAGEKSTLAFELRGFWPDFPEPGSHPMVYTQSNLDLRQYYEGGDEVEPPEEFVPPPPGEPAGPDAVDPNDTVEQVRAPNDADDMVLKVESASTIEGLDAEPFAITSAVPLTPLIAPRVEPVELSSSHADPVRCGSEVTIAARAENESPDMEAEQTKLSLELPAGVQLVSGSSEKEVGGGGLGPGDISDPVSWVVKPTADGNHDLRFAGSGETYGTSFVRTDPSARVQVRADCHAPQTTITSGPSGLTADATSSFSFRSSEPGSAFRCSVDGAPYTACSSPRTQAFEDGPHVFRVAATDAAGNVDLTPAASTFTIDSAVDAPRAAVRGRHPKPRKRTVGAVAARMGEVGSVTVTGAARWRRGAASLLPRTYALEPGVKRRIELPVRRKPARRLKRAQAKGRVVAVRVGVEFEDPLGNVARRSVGFRLRR